MGASCGDREQGSKRSGGGPASVGAFLALARVVGGEARALGLRVPAFRSPPRRPGATRTLRRVADGTAVVAVAVAGRPLAAVAGDVVDGVIVANGLQGEAAARVRERLVATAARKVGASPGGGTGQTRPP